MANSDIREFVFYDQYIWQAADFTNLQIWLADQANGLGEALGGSALMTGGLVQPSGGLNLQVDPAIGFSVSNGVDGKGQLLVLPAQTPVTVPSNAQPSKCLLVLRPVQTPETFIPEPLNPGNMVPLHVGFGTQLVLIAGIPAPSPVYPAIQAGDVVIMGITVPGGASSLNINNLDRTPIMVPRQKLLGIVSTSQDGFMASSGEAGEDIIEADGSMASTGVTVNLPPAVAFQGRYKTLVNVGSSNPVGFFAPEGISGQQVQLLDAQWSSMRVYSNGKSYRVV